MSMTRRRGRRTTNLVLVLLFLVILISLLLDFELNVGEPLSPASSG